MTFFLVLSKTETLETYINHKLIEISNRPNKNVDIHFEYKYYICTSSHLQYYTNEKSNSSKLKEEININKIKSYRDIRHVVVVTE